MGTLANRLATKPENPGCKLGQILALPEFDDEDRAAVYHEDTSAVIIGDHIRALGHKVGNTTISKHRSRLCACENGN